MTRNLGRNAKLARPHNRAVALKMIIQAGAISRKDLARKIGLTQAAITKISEELITQGIIREDKRAESTNSPGRRPIPLTVDPDKFRILTVFISRRVIKSYLTNARAEILNEDEATSHQIFHSPRQTKSALLHHISDLIARWEIRKKEFFGVALAAPGPVRAGRDDRNGGKVVSRYSNPYAWDDLSGFLTKRLGCPVFAENDANVMALGEQWFGCGQGCNHFVTYVVGEGIGAAAIIDGMLYRGHENVVAEVGHITVQMDGERCGCGNYGCLELYAGFAKLREKYRELRPLPAALPYHADLRELFDRCAHNDPDCAALVGRHAKLLSVGAVTLANMFSPEKIIVASYDGKSVDLAPFVADMRTSIRERAFSAIVDAIGVEESALGDRLVACGGVALAISEMFNEMAGAGGASAPE